MGLGTVLLCLVVRRCGHYHQLPQMKEHSYVETVCYILMGLSVLVVFKQLLPLRPYPAIGLSPKGYAI